MANPKLKYKVDSTKAYQHQRAEFVQALGDEEKADEALATFYSALDEDGSPLKHKNPNRNHPAYSAWHNEQKTKIEAQSKKEMDDYDKKHNIFEGQSFGDRFMRGAVSGNHDEKNVINYLSGNEIDKASLKVVNDAQAMDEAYSKSERTPVRQKEVERLDKEYEKADGFINTVGTGVSLLWDKAWNLDEANIAGGIGSMFTPVNLVGGIATGGVGSLASKAVTGVGKKAVVGAVAGATADTALNSGYEYSSAKSQGKSDKEAEKAAIMG